MGFLSRIGIASRVLLNELKKDDREELCADLQALGVDAKMAERGRPEEKIGGMGSLGLIDIDGGPIRWVNVRTLDSYDESRTFNHFDSYTDYGVPDPRLGPNSPRVRIESASKKSNLHRYWRGNDSGLGIISRLNSDTPIKYAMMNNYDDVKIRAHGDHGCWIISARKEPVPLEELWSCYQAIAKHLLAEWPLG